MKDHPLPPDPEPSLGRCISLTRRQAGAVVRLLGEFQVFLEESIDGVLIDGKEPPPDSPCALDENGKAQLLHDRRNWRAAEDIRVAIFDSLKP